MQEGSQNYSDFAPIEGYWPISQTVQGKLVLITNRKSHMSFRLVPKSVTLNDLERRNGVILRYFTEFVLCRCKTIMAASVSKSTFDSL